MAADRRLSIAGAAPFGRIIAPWIAMGGESLAQLTKMEMLKATRCLSIALQI
jgi:hypothetical protein